MDLALAETQQAVTQAAAHVLSRGQPQAAEHDRGLWKEFAQAGLRALALAGSMGGDGLAVLDTAVLLTEAGRCAARALATLAMGVLPVTRW